MLKTMSDCFRDSSSWFLSLHCIKLLFRLSVLFLVGTHLAGCILYWSVKGLYLCLFVFWYWTFCLLYNFSPGVFDWLLFQFAPVAKRSTVHVCNETTQTPLPWAGYDTRSIVLFIIWSMYLFNSFALPSRVGLYNTPTAPLWRGKTLNNLMVRFQ